MSVVADVSQPLVEVSAPPATLAIQTPLFRLSVDQYHEMVRHGILTEDHDVELLDGLLVAKMTKNTAHHVAKLLVQSALAKVIPEGWYVDSQDAITLATSEPEPDVMVVRGQPRDYLEHHPLARDLAMVVEISDSSLQPRSGLQESDLRRGGDPSLLDHQPHRSASGSVHGSDRPGRSARLPPAAGLQRDRTGTGSYCRLRGRTNPCERVVAVSEPRGSFLSQVRERQRSVYLLRRRNTRNATSRAPAASRTKVPGSGTAAMSDLPALCSTTEPPTADGSKISLPPRRPSARHRSARHSRLSRSACRRRRWFRPYTSCCWRALRCLSRTGQGS